MAEVTNIENYNERLSYLTNEVSKVTYDNTEKSFLPKNINYTYITIISLPIIILILLVIIKPRFVKTKSKNDKDEEITKVSYIRIIIITLLLYVIEFLIKFFVIDKNVSKPKIIS